MKTFLSLLLILSTCFVSAQKFKTGTIEFADGKVLKGLLKPPSDPSDKKIDFKQNEDAEKQTFLSKDLKKIHVVIDDTTTHDFEYLIAKRPAKKGTFKNYDPAWLNVLVKGPATLYVAGQHFKINRKGKLIITGRWTGGVPPDTYFFLHRKGEDFPLQVAIYSPATIMLDKYFRASLSEYFKDYPKLVERINAKEFKVLDIADVTKIYNDWKVQSEKKAKPKSTNSKTTKKK